MRKVVDFTVLDGDAMDMVPFGRVVLENGIISFDGLSEHFIRELHCYGVIGDPKEGPLFPRDGERFLEALHREFSGSALRASAVHDVKERRNSDKEEEV